MKVFFVSAAIFSTQTFLYSQPSITGRWMTISAFDDDIYINSKTDSFHMSEKFKMFFGDSLPMAKKFFQITYLGTSFEFNEDGTYHIFPAEDPEVIGTYVANKIDSTILLNRTNSTIVGNLIQNSF
jgi:hypothetical protein